MQGGFIYIIQSLTLGIFYIGSCTNPEKRLYQHNAGLTASTRNKGPWIIKFTQHFDSMTIARQIEYRLKKLKRRDYIEQIIKDGYIKKR